MKQVTISVTAPQAVKILEQIKTKGAVEFNVRAPRKRGEQHGGFLPILAALAGPALGAIASKGIDYLMGNGVVQAGHGPCLTCTERQYHTLKSQLGSGAQIAINFKIRSPGAKPSLFTQQAHQTLAGAGIYSTIAGLLGKLGSSAYQALTSNTAKKIASNAAQLGIKAASEKAQEYAKNKFMSEEEKQAAEAAKTKSAVVPLDLFPSAPTNNHIANIAPPRSSRPRKQRGTGLELAGDGMALAGNGLRLAGRPATTQKKFVIRTRNTNGSFIK